MLLFEEAGCTFFNWKYGVNIEKIVVCLLFLLFIVSGDQINDSQYTAKILKLEDNIEMVHYGPYLSKIKVAIIDTEVKFNHPYFSDRVRNPEVLFIDDVTKNNDNSHGTEVAGVISKYLDSVQLISIVIPQVSSVDVLARAIDIAIEKNVDIINISLSSFKDDKLLKEAVKRAITKGVIIVCSAGNDGTNRKTYPAAYDGVISVSGLTKNGAILPYSNFIILLIYTQLVRTYPRQLSMKMVNMRILFLAVLLQQRLSLLRLCQSQSLTNTI